MNRRLSRHLAFVPALALFAATPCPAQEEETSGSVDLGVGAGSMNININVKDGTRQGPHGKAEVSASAHEEFTSNKPGEAFKLAYDSTENGATSFKVLAPEGLLVRISQNGLQVASDTIPMSYSAQRGQFYRFEIVSRQGVVFDKKFEAKDGMVGSLWAYASAPPPRATVAAEVSAPARAGPCLDSGDLGAITGQISEESFSEQKLAVLETAISSRSLCSDQVIEVLGLYSFSKDKLQALRLMKPHISDPQNHFKILGAFTFDGDKKQAKGILGG